MGFAARRTAEGRARRAAGRLTEKALMVFSQTEIREFITDGFVILRAGFPAALAARGREFIWNRIGSWEKCTTWNQPMVHLQEAFGGEPFARVLTPRIRAAVDELTGVGRAIIPESLGWWSILLPGFPGPGGWHIDGTFQHHLTSPEQGLVTVFLFSDVDQGDGGTPVVQGSHQVVARLLAVHEPAGLSPQELQAKLPEAEPNKVVAVTGAAGDVAMLHPLLIHGFGPNRGNRIRFACNPQYALRQSMQLDRADGAYSPVEHALREALGRD